MFHYRSTRKQSGFTIVELLIVIVIIAVLAVIVIVGFNGVQKRSRVSLVDSTLSNVRKSLELTKAETGSYPASLSGLNYNKNLANSSNVTLTYTPTDPQNATCVSGSYQGADRNIDIVSGKIQDGPCTGHSAGGLGPEVQTPPQNLVASTTYPGGYEASKAADGDINTFWHAGSGSPQWLQWDYAGQNKVVTKVDIGQRPYGGRWMTAFNIEASNDASSWTTIASFSGLGANTDGNPVPYSFTNTASYRYWRIFIASHASDWDALTEIKTYTR